MVKLHKSIIVENTVIPAEAELCFDDGIVMHEI